MPPDGRAQLDEAAASAVARDEPLVRFDAVQRAAHWVTALLFLTLMATGAVLYAGPFSQLVGRRGLVRQIHVWSGLALPLPLVAAMVGRWGRRLRHDLGALNRWSRDDARWFGATLRRRRRVTAPARLGKFNPGQKLNATFLAASGVVMLGTGAIMKWYEPFPLDWRTGATFVHDWFAFGIWLSVLGHIYLATREREVLDGMVRGTVPAWWARDRAPRWYAEMRRRPVEEPPPGAPQPD